MAKSTKALETLATSDMISIVADKFSDLPKRVTKEILQDFLQTIENEVASGKKIRIDHVGILYVKARAARKGRNPQNGESIDIPASKKVSFRPAKSLKERVTGTRKIQAKRGAKPGKVKK